MLENIRRKEKAEQSKFTHILYDSPQRNAWGFYETLCVKYRKIIFLMFLFIKIDIII